MEQEQFDALTGTVMGINMTLAAVIQSLTQLQAAQAAVSLKIELETERMAGNTGSSTQEQARDSIVEAYLGALQAASQ